MKDKNSKITEKMEQAKYSFPIYYSGKEYDDLPLLPYIVSFLEDPQDKAVIAPQLIYQKESEFKQVLYGLDVFSAFKPCVAFRCFRFVGKVCVSLILKANRSDQFTRGGLLLTIGFIVNNIQSKNSSGILSMYLRTMIKTINCHFNISLMKGDANIFMDAIEQAYSKTVDIPKFYSLFNALILPSYSLLHSNFYRSGHSSFFNNFLFKRKVPKIIYYNPDAAINEIYDIFLNEVGALVNSSGYVGSTENIGDSNTTDSNLITLLPLPQGIGCPKDIKMKYRKGKPYICFY